MLKHYLVSLSLTTALVLSLCACSDDTDNTPPDAKVADAEVADAKIPDAKVPDAPPKDIAPDKATVKPDQGSKVPQLSAKHSGWKKALCFDCHGTTASYKHPKDKYKPTNCGGCHGYNGAPHKDHATKSKGNCTGCHSASKSAHIAKFTSPDDCILCHYQK